MTTDTNGAGGLPELPDPCRRKCYGELFEYFDADQLRAYGELCRATREGDGEAEVLCSILAEYKQCDEDGTMCEVSRQAVDEAIALLRTLSRVAVQEGMDDAKRFEWCIANAAAVAKYESGYQVFYASERGCELTRFPTAREAIDDATQRQEGGSNG